MSNDSADWDGYKGDARKKLELVKAHAGARVKLSSEDGLVVVGILVPRYEHAESDHIVLKLKSGYNIGIRASKINSLTVLEENVSRFGQANSASTEVEDLTAEKTILLLSTGGTIASRVDYRTGAVHPALSASDLYAAVPELGELATIIPEVVFSTYSENLTPLEWQELSEAIVFRSTNLGDKLAGIVVMLGTDTLAYVSAALSFSLQGLRHPVVCVGAQRSSDRPSSDAALNLKAATYFAAYSNAPGVYVSMHENENDDFIAIHCGTRIRKNHTSRRDAFESIDSSPVARVCGKEIFLFSKDQTYSLRENLQPKTRFDSRVALVKFHPGFDSSILDYYVETRGIRGIVIEGTGLGHVSSATVEKLSSLIKQGLLAFMTSQCIWGRVDLNVYETGRDLLEAGVIPLENMISETAFAKLSWALGNYEPNEVKEIMLNNIAGEFSERILLFE